MSAFAQSITRFRVGLLRCCCAALQTLFICGYAAAQPGTNSEANAADFEVTASPVTPVFEARPLTPNALNVPKRLFGVIPNFRADQYQATYVALTAAQKFQLAQQDSFDWPNYLLLAGYALQSEMAVKGDHRNAVTDFGRFYARSAADQIVGSYITEAFLPVAFHEDPRFFRVGQGAFWHRLSNAASWVVVARRDNGSRGLATSELVGNAVTVTIGDLYYPGPHSAREALGRYSMALGNDVISNLLTEFWPDIRQRLSFHRRSRSIE